MISEKGRKKLTEKGAAGLISKIFQVILTKGKGGVVQDGLLENWVVDLIGEEGLKIQYFQSHHGSCKGKLEVVDSKNRNRVVFELKTEIPTYRVGRWEGIIKRLYGHTQDDYGPK